MCQSQQDSNLNNCSNIYEMNYRFPIIVGILLLIMLSACTEVRECKLSNDCEGKEHPNCSSDWLCIDGKCVWGCGECSLSLCDCKCYLKGETPEELENKLCGVNCLEEYNVGGCKYVAGKCIPVYAEKQVKSGECSSDDDCGTGGCSGQICAPKEKVKGIITTCEYKPEYGCLKMTSCRCIDGKCQWDETTEYRNCLKSLENSTNTT